MNAAIVAVLPTDEEILRAIQKRIDDRNTLVQTTAPGKTWENRGGWWYADRRTGQHFGPYETQKEARAACDGEVAR